MRLLILGGNRELTAGMHHVHDLNAGGRDTIEHYVVWCATISRKPGTRSLMWYR